ncbi:hypothetical protein F5Y19DRAFT_487752 [Xylariaceae sp. FL1651]|nr:hypothetical protein F5Y19DRAFT_487752 [Xylariaceae sp. FL1651]
MAPKPRLLHISGFLCFAALAAAIPNVTVVSLPSSCASFPKYDDTTGVAGPLEVVADSTGKGIDGTSFVPKYATAVNGGAWGFITIPLDNAINDTATPMRCGNGSLQAQLNTGFAGVQWQTLVAAGTPAESVFGFGLPNLPDPNYELEPYAHVVDGVTQPGVFIGAVNVTTWGFNYQNSTETGEYYFLRLLGPNSHNLATGEQLNEGEFMGFIKVEV